MKLSKERYPLSTLCGLKDKIDTNPDYQRPPAWGPMQKQLLMDTILRKYDIPKMYWHRIGDDDDFEVIDGQQRLRAIWDFHDGKFALAKDASPINGIACAGKKYSELDINTKRTFDIYPVDIVIVEEAKQNKEEDEIRDMFLRLQNGTTLNAQEKRNAMTGDMRDHVVKLGKHEFFENYRIKKSRYNYDHLAAQVTCIELAGGPTTIQKAALDKMYKDNKIFDEKVEKCAKKVNRTLNYLLQEFPEKLPELESHHIITLYCLASTVVESYVYDGIQGNLHACFAKFEKDRKRNDGLDDEQKEIEFLEYENLTGNSTDGEASIAKRLDFLSRRFFLEYSDILPKDEKKSFSRGQRLAIYRKNDGKCQLKIRCDGKDKLAWDNGWHADHITPHSKGGKTIVSNGQVACPECNLAKSNKALV